MKYLGYFPALSPAEVEMICTNNDAHLIRCAYIFNFVKCGILFLLKVLLICAWQVQDHVSQARKAQKIWAKSSFKQRRQFLRILLKYIIEHQELICE